MTEKQTEPQVAADAQPETDEPFVPTKAEDYPVDGDLELTLPSGAKVIVKRPNKYALLLAGRFPKEVETAIRAASEDRVAPDFLTRIKSLDYLICEAFVSPKFHITPKKGCRSIREMPDPDSEFVVAILGLSVF